MENGRKAGADRHMKKQRIWPVLLAAGIGICILCGLGVWQVKRLAWKEALIAEVDVRMMAEPMTLPEALNRGGDTEYTRITARGRYLPSQPLRRMASINGSPGYELLQPFLSADGVFVLVDRGTVSVEDSDPAIAATTDKDVTITGLVRLHNKGRGSFDGNNDDKGNLWVWWDIPAMLAASQPPANAQQAPFILQLVPSPELPSKPFVAAPKVELSNNHLGYAITWFGLAAALVGVTGVYVFRLRRV
jgi:surfeit locus 1 family protein